MTNALANRWESAAKWLARPLMPTGDANRFVRTVVLGRVLLGLILLHQYGSNYGCSGLCDPEQADQVRTSSLIAIGLGACVAVGLATPAALGGLIWFIATGKNIHSLGSHVALLSLWGLIFLGAGRHLGVDAWLMDRRGWRWLRGLYVFAWDHSPATIGFVRLGLLIGYWGLCLNAMGHHVLDPRWQCGATVRLLYTSSYFSDFYAAGQTLQEMAPALFRWGGLIALLLQSLWELLLVPVLYVKGGRWLCGGYGWFFFVLCLLTVNLGYLPCYEILLWLLVFPPGELLRRPACGWPDLENAWKLRGARLVTGFAGILVALSVVLHNPLVARYAPSLVIQEGRCRKALTGLCYGFGQGNVDVFNGRDIGMLGETVLVLAEIDPQGQILRLVPYMDAQGGRLLLLRNELLYYGFSIPWHATNTAETFDGSNGIRNSHHAADLAHRFCMLDACLRNAAGPCHYRAWLSTRTLTGPPETCSWSPLEPRLTLDVRLSSDELVAAKTRHGRAFILPPGHQFSDTRTGRTLDALRTATLAENTTVRAL